MSQKPKITMVTAAGPDHQVVTLEGGKGGFRRTVCSDCPWRKDAVGEFPPEAFKHSANTAYDMSDHIFSCHQSGIEKPAACAGFLLRGADHNMKVRFKYVLGEIKRGDVKEPKGISLHENYRAMAIANGVPKDDPSLVKCRD
jgi:hypothetical protein